VSQEFYKETKCVGFGMKERAEEELHY